MFIYFYYCFHLMKILVVAAMQSELKAIKEWIKLANLKENLNIDYLCCCIWIYETIFSWENYFTKFVETTFVLNIWICWYWNNNGLIKNEPIQVWNIINLHTEKEYIIPPFLQIAPMKTVFSSETVIGSKPLFKKNSLNWLHERFCDMESRWIEFVSSKLRYPRLFLKVPFDFIGENSNFLVKSPETIDKIYSSLKNLNYNDYLKKILEWIKQQEKPEN